jgi:molybdopterin converting factor small subunit
LKKIKIRSIYALGITAELRSRFFSGKDVILEVEPGTVVEQLLKKMPFLGPPELYDDLMIHVFVNGTQQGFDYELQSNDVIDIHIPVSGG